MNSLSVAVVGHANAGKTSLMRTLLRDSEFGEVADQAGTTRHVEGSALVIDESSQLALFDTPGLEDSIHLLHILTGYFSGESVDGIDRLLHFLEELPLYPELEQEAKVLRALLNCDLIFYVIDLREPVLGKYRDELQVLSYAAKPVVPVLNFTRQGGGNLADWKKQLARLNLHAYVCFDNVFFQFSDELKIYQKMQTLLADQESLLADLIKQRQLQWLQLLTAAQELIAELFIEAACVRYKADNDQHSILEKTELLQKVVRRAEKKCVSGLLKLYQFKEDELAANKLPIEHGQWQTDLFSLDNLQEFGLSLTGNITKGAGIGVAVDLAVGGITLGAAAATGGFMGALWSVKERYYEQIEAKIKGSRYICLNDQTLQVLWLRQLKLLTVLQQRGHASVTKIDYQINEKTHCLPDNWRKLLQQLRSHPQWSSLNQKQLLLGSEKRNLLLAELIEQMQLQPVC